MKIKLAIFGALVFVLAATASSWAMDLRAEMEAANAEWLAAYNSMQGASLGTMYSDDATLLPPDSQVVATGDDGGSPHAKKNRLERMRWEA